MRIGIACYPTHGGSGILATELGIALANRGHQVHFVTHDKPFRLDNHPNIFYHEVAVNSYDLFKYPPYTLALASKLARVANEYHLDIIHAHYAVPHAIAAILAKDIAAMAGVSLKVITTLHGTDVTVMGVDPCLRDAICFGIEKSDAVTTVSDSLREQTRDLLGVKKPIDRIYNFVDTKTYFPQEIDDLRAQYPANEKILMHISNYRPVKRPLDLVDIFAGVHKKIPARLLLVGDGPAIPEMREKVREIGLENNVEFLGKQKNIAQWLSLADLFLLPSEQESFGLVALEAMACGVPTIGSCAGGIPEVVIHGETGYLAGIGQIDKMIEFAIQLLKNDELYRRFVQNGLHLVKNNFEETEIVSKYEALYHRVAGNS